MKKSNRLISMVLCFCMCISLFIVPGTAYAEDGVISDEKLGLLSALDIIDDVSAEDLNLQVSRAEFAVYIVKFANLDSSLTEERKFNDVMSGVYEENYISTAVEAGLMAPVATDYFYPGYPVTYAEAAQAFVMSLGYTEVVKNDNSYLARAQNLGILNGVDSSGVFTRSKLLLMMYNALHAPTLNISGFAGDGVIYSKENNVDALKAFHNLEHDEGIITAAGGIELGGSFNDTYKEHIKHNGNTYYMNTVGVKEALGRNAVIYYTEESEVVYAMYKRNRELKLNPQDINSYNNFVYYYGENDKKIQLSNPYVIYNGEEYTNPYTESVMIPESGSVTLVDNNNDGKYDLVILESYQDYKVKSRIDDTNTILTEYGQPISLDDNTYDVTIYNTKGQLDNFKAVGKDMIVSVAVSPKRVTVYACNKSVTGILDSVSVNSDEREWLIGDEVYSPSATLAARLDSGLDKEPEVGHNYKWYFNVDGDIAFFEESASEGSGKYYAILTKVGVKQNFDATVKVRVFAKELGGFQTLECAEKVVLNGIKQDKAAVENAMKRNGVNGQLSTEVVAQPVKISTNADGKVNFIAQAGAKDNTNSEFRFFMGSLTDKTRYIPYRNILEIFSQNWSVEENPYFTVNTGFTGCLQIGVSDDTTICYQVPYKADGTIDGELEEVFLSKKLTKSGTMYSFVYTEDEDDFLSSLVLEAVDAEVKENCANSFDIKAVTKITKGLYDDEVVTIVHTNDGAYYLKDSQVDLNNLLLYDANGNVRLDENGNNMTYCVKPGDLVNILLDATGYIAGIEAIYDAENGVMLTENGTSASVRNGDGWRVMKSELLETKGGYMRATTGSASNFIAGTDRYVLTQIPNKTVVVKKDGNQIKTSIGSVADYIGYKDSPDDYTICIVGSKFMQIQGTKMATFLYRYKDWN